MKRKIISFMLTLAPCSTKKLTISNDWAFFAISRGLLKIYRKFYKTMINLKRKRISLNNDKYEKKENAIKR